MLSPTCGEPSAPAVMKQHPVGWLGRPLASGSCVLPAAPASSHLEGSGFGEPTPKPHAHWEDWLPRPVAWGVKGRSPPKGVHIRIPKTCDCVALHGKRDFADRMK